MSPLSDVYAIADRYVEEYAALDPTGATGAGIPGHDDEMTDYSPVGADARDRLRRDTVAALAQAPHDTDDDRIAAAVMTERLQVSIDQHDAGEALRALRIIGSPVQSVRDCFDLMAYDSDDDWETAAARLERVPAALASFESTLREGVKRNVVSARRQALACATQAETWGGQTEGIEPFFRALVAKHSGNAALHGRLEQGAGEATTAYAQLAVFLRDEYAPKANPHDPVGRDRYQLFSRARSTASSSTSMTRTRGGGRSCIASSTRCGRLPSASCRASRYTRSSSISNTTRTARSRASTSSGSGTRISSTTRSRSSPRTHFDIAEPLHRCEAMIAPPGGAAAMYYTGPSEDFSRPGRTWYPTLGRTTFPLWREVSTCYHEAVPGHHLQVAQVRYLHEKLSRYQRAYGFISGHGEGWALYAERLMGELGYLDDPAWELGMLSAQAMRAVRVVVDIGMHLEMPIPDSEPAHAGERWTPELALPFVIERSRFPEKFMRSEVDRYLGWPAQAISYKVGERVWLECRADAQARHGDAFDLKAFHTYALNLGSMGLGPLREELARF